MKNTFVTLFDSNYLSRGLVLYESLLKWCNNFLLYIIAMDDRCCSFLRDQNLDSVIVISLSEFEDDELLSVKQSRSRAEYCWTSTPKSLQYVLSKYYEPICTYIDSDVFFFSDPSVLLDEIPHNKSVMITEHRYSEYCDATDVSGVYNVQFMTFKNDEDSKNVLNWWGKKCIENCCLDPERGLCGDQKYLDDWTERFGCVYVMKNYGGGVAPWNVDQFSYEMVNNRIVMKNNQGLTGLVVFYHFHALRFFDKGVIALTNGNYSIPDTAVAYLYKPYINMHETVIRKYNLDRECIKQEHFRDDSVDNLRKDRNYYLLDLFL